MSSRMRRGTCSKLSQNNSTIAAIMRLSPTGPGRFSSRLMLGCEHRSSPLSGSRPTAILKQRIGSERIAVVAVGIARHDQHRPVADHFGKPVQHPVGIAPVFDASGQAFGTIEGTLTTAARNLAQVSVAPTTDKPSELVADKGYHSRAPLKTLAG